MSISSGAERVHRQRLSLSNDYDQGFKKVLTKRKRTLSTLEIEADKTPDTILNKRYG